MGKLIGSRLAIEDGLWGIARAVREDMENMSEGQRKRCGDVEQWTAFGTEFMQDLGVSKEEWRMKMMREKLEKRRGVEESKGGRPWQASSQGQHHQQGPSRQGPGGSDDCDKAIATRRGLPPQDNSVRHRSAAEGLSSADNSVSNPSDTDPDVATPRQPIFPPLHQLLQLPKTPPDFTISIPKAAEGYLLGFKGNVIMGIVRDCGTPCFLERRLSEPRLEIWGTAEHIARVMEGVNQIVSRHCRSWRVGEKGPHWGAGRTAGDVNGTTGAHPPSASHHPRPPAPTEHRFLVQSPPHR